MRARLARLLSLFAVLFLASVMPALAQAPTRVQQDPSRLDAGVVAQHSHTTATTLTITPPAGQFVYVIGLDISNCATGTAVTAAAPTYITTTGLNGSPQYQIGSGVTAGLCQPVPVGFSPQAPLKSATPGSAVTFVLPTFATNQVVSFNVYYYFAQ